MMSWTERTMRLGKGVRVAESRSQDSPSSRFLSASHRCRALKPWPKDAVRSPLKHLQLPSTNYGKQIRLSDSSW